MRPTEVTTDEAPARAGKIRLAVVDDSPTVVLAVCAAAEHDDRFAVVGTARDGLAGLSLVASTAPDVVLLDVDMPVMTGLAALRGIRAASPGTVVVMYSASITDGEREAALAT